MNLVPRTLPPSTNLLDVREDPCGKFVRGASWIPFSELRDRIGELPPPSTTILIANLDGLAEVGQAFLRAGGRDARLFDSFELTDQPQRFRLWSANPYMIQRLSKVSPGHAIDLGCGAGREAVTLAASGFQVLAIDNLPDAIQRCRSLAERYGLGEQLRYGSEVKAADWEEASLFCSFFLFDRIMLAEALRKLRTGCQVLLEVFTQVHAEKFGKPSEHRYAKTGELKNIEGLEVIDFSEGWRNDSGRHTARLHAVVRQS